MPEKFGILLDGNLDILNLSYDEFNNIPVDLNIDEVDESNDDDIFQTTIAKSVEVCSQGTFSKSKIRKLLLEPSEKEGWWFERTDLPYSSPIKVVSRNVWTTGNIVNNIVLRSGSMHNYIRLVEHIIALRPGMNIDNLKIKVSSGDPPLFDHGSKELVDAIQEAGIKKLKDKKVRYFTVKEKVTMATHNGGFTIFSPPERKSKSLRIDCARNFPNAIGKQRIQFTLNKKTLNLGAQARTNTTAKQKLFCQTLGFIFADIRNLGYNKNNVLIAGKNKYLNKAELIHNGKSLEAVWHRAVLDLLAGIGLMEEGRFVADIIDYKGGHYTDVEMIKNLYNHNLIEEYTL